MPYFTSPLPASRVVTTLDRQVAQSCVGRGKPAPTITWYKDGGAVDSRKFLVVNVVRNVSYTKEVSSTLRWEGAGRNPRDGMEAEDNGNYSCVVTTPLDEEIKRASSMQLTVQCKFY